MGPGTLASVTGGRARLPPPKPRAAGVTAGATVDAGSTRCPCPGRCWPRLHGTSLPREDARGGNGDHPRCRGSRLAPGHSGRLLIGAGTTPGRSPSGRTAPVSVSTRPPGPSAGPDAEGRLVCPTRGPRRPRPLWPQPVPGRQTDRQTDRRCSRVTSEVAPGSCALMCLAVCLLVPWVTRASRAAQGAGRPVA